MEIQALIAALEDVAERLDMDVRRDEVEDGGMMTLRGSMIIVLPIDAPPQVQADILAASLSRVSVDDVFVVPEVREFIEGFRPAE